MINTKQETLKIKLNAGRFLKRLKYNVYALRFQGGFTLVEFLIVISVIALSVGSVLVFLTSTIKGSNQANIIAEVRQNGQAVLDNLQTNIRASKKAEVPTTGFGDARLFLTLASGGNLSVICTNAVGTTANGYIAISKRSTIDTTMDPVLTNYQNITNANLVSGIDITCGTTFRVNTNTNIVIISFVANQAVGAPSRVDFKANATFVTTVGIRSY